MGRRARYAVACSAIAVLALLLLAVAPAGQPLSFSSVGGQAVVRRTIQWNDFVNQREGSFVVTVPVDVYERSRADAITRARILLGDDAAYVDLVDANAPAMRAVAAQLRKVAGDNDELFADLALQVAHQSVYRSTFAAKSGLETLAQGEGDCDPFVVLVASIVRAGGLPVVLLLYKPRIGLSGFGEGHMQLGVGLPEPPQLLGKRAASAHYVEHEGQAYFVAETTLKPGFNPGWREGWRVGQSGAPRGFGGPDAILPVP